MSWHAALAVTLGALLALLGPAILVLRTRRLDRRQPLAIGLALALGMVLLACFQAALPA